MTEVNCVDVERLGNVLDYPDDHPVRRHIETCPRCRTVFDSYRAFLAVEPSAGADLEEARAYLDAVIKRRAGTAVPARQRTALRARRTGWFGGLLRPMPALAAAVIVAVAAIVLMRSDRALETPALRTDGGSASGWQLHEPLARTDGSVVLSWGEFSGADAYEIRLYDPALETIARLGPTGETSFVLDRSALPADLAPDSELTWRVIALRGGAEVASSPPRSVRLP